MTQALRLTLFGTSGCHLCEQAEWLLLPLAQAQGWQLQLCDIAEQADSEDLISRYGSRIPVLRLDDAELDWPFEASTVQAWLATHGGQ